MNLYRVTAAAALFTSLLFSLSSGALSQDLGPWRKLTAEEEKARIGDTPPDSADPSMITADFDGDGTRDQALIAVRNTDQARGLIVVMRNTVQVLVLSGENRKGINADKSSLSDAGLQVAEPGSWEPNCFDDECFKKPARKQMLKLPGILLYDRGATVLYFWSPKAKRFMSSLMVH